MADSNLSRRGFLGATSLVLLGLWPGLSYARMIHRLQGEVSINGEPASLDAVIRSGDVLRTGKDGSLVFAVGEDVHELGPESSLQLSWEEKNTAVGVLRLLSGYLSSSFGKGDKRIQVPTAVLGIRGTFTFVKLEEGQTYFCTCYGKTHIDNGHGEGQAVSATHHQAYRISHDPAAEITPAPMLYHGDDGVLTLDRLAGRTSPPEFQPK